MNEVIVAELESTKEASDRGRWVLLVMQVACILIFMAGLHQVPDGWTYSRLRTAQAAVWLLDCSSEPHPEFPQSNKSNPELEKIRHDECHFIPGGSPIHAITKHRSSDCQRTAQKPFCEDEIEHARQFLADRRFSAVEARKHLESLHSSFVDHAMNVSVPFLGITLDANDLGILGGITFLLLLTWLLFSLRREGENVRMLFTNATNEDLPGVYKLLSMTQVLTVPPEMKTKHKGLVKFLWLCLERILFFSPLGVQGFIVWMDWKTLSLAQPLNPELAYAELHWEYALLAGMIGLTTLCLLKTLDIGRHWKKAYERFEALSKE